MSKPPALGSINPADTVILFDARQRTVAACYETPNALCVAFEECPSATHAQSYSRRYTRQECTQRSLSEDQRARLRQQIRIF
jgi:hypothetical protein